MGKLITGANKLQTSAADRRSFLRSAIYFLFSRQSITGFICALFIILYIYTGLNKLMDLPEFRLQMERSPFIGRLSDLIAYTLPPGELLIAVALITERFRLQALYFSLFMMALFTGYIWLMLRYAPDLPCTCGGIISKMSWNDHLVFNAGFTALAIAGILLHKKVINHKT